MARPVEVLEMSVAEREELERRVRASTTAQRDCLRARIVLLRHQGLSQREVAERLDVSLACRSAPGTSARKPTTTTGTVRSACSPPSATWRAS